MYKLRVWKSEVDDRGESLLGGYYYTDELRLAPVDVQETEAAEERQIEASRKRRHDDDDEPRVLPA